jgi:endonuclease/exonuclease/phosphatase family metal-dependent hydrolase
MVRRIDLSYPGDREPRGALQVDVNVQGTALRLLVTHLGLTARERAWQIQQLLKVLRPKAAGMVILLGDFNAWWPHAAPLRSLRRHFDAQQARRTFPSNFPVLALDRIWVCPARAATEVTTHRSPIARVASDHLPLVARIRL